jgi:hypothetical protein
VRVGNQHVVMGFVPVLMCCLLGSCRRGPAIRNPDVFHDREGFTTVWSIKSFAIMKIRSGMRIAAAGRAAGPGMRGRPGGRGRGPRTRGPGRAFPVFRRPPRVRITSDRTVSRTSALLQDPPYYSPPYKAFAISVS